MLIRRIQGVTKSKYSLTVPLPEGCSRCIHRLRSAGWLATQCCAAQQRFYRSGPEVGDSRLDDSSALSPEHQEMLTLLESISVENGAQTALRMRRPSIPSRTFGVALPPKWAAEVPRRLARQPWMLSTEGSMPLSSKKVYLFQQAFIHPSFVRADRDHTKDQNSRAADASIENVVLRFTNYSLAVQGHALLRTALLHWAVAVDPNLSAQLMNELVGSSSSDSLITDESLARVASIHWGVDDLLLGDGKSYEKAIALQKKSAGAGGVLPSASQGVSSRPMSHVATIVPSLCAAVYLAHGMEVAFAFIGESVLPLLVSDARAMQKCSLVDGE